MSKQEIGSQHSSNHFELALFQRPGVNGAHVGCGHGHVFGGVGEDGVDAVGGEHDARRHVPAVVFHLEN